MFEWQATEKQSRRRVRERKDIFPNTNKFHPKRELAMKWLHNIGAGHTVEKFNFNRKMVCQHHVIVDLEHRLLGLGERRLVNEDIAPTEFVNRKKSPGPSNVAMPMACEERSRKRDKHNVCKYYKWATRIQFNIFPL